MTTDPSHLFAMVTEFETTWILVSVGLLFIGVFLTSLCSHCPRRSFELQELVVEKNPSTLIRVVKLEEVFENPEVPEDEKDKDDVLPGEDPSWTVVSSNSQQMEPQTPTDSLPEEVTFTPWRSHLMAPENKGVTDFVDTSNDVPSPAANQDPAVEQVQDAALVAVTNSGDSVYARVSKKQCSTNTPVHTPVYTPVEEEDEVCPPLPDRTEG